jgi:hypothetical protein
MAYYYCLLWDRRRRIALVIAFAWVFTYIPGLILGIISLVKYYSKHAEYKGKAC